MASPFNPTTFRMWKDNPAAEMYEMADKYIDKATLLNASALILNQYLVNVAEKKGVTVEHLLATGYISKAVIKSNLIAYDLNEAFKIIGQQAVPRNINPQVADTPSTSAVIDKSHSSNMEVGSPTVEHTEKVEMSVPKISNAEKMDLADDILANMDKSNMDNSNPQDGKEPDSPIMDITTL